MLESHTRANWHFQRRPHSTGLRAGARRIFVACLILQAALVAPSIAAGQVTIKDDYGGNIGEYWSRFTAIRDAKEWVVVDGICSSACTMVLGIVPRDRICVTRNAQFGFHAAWRSGFLGFRVTNGPATQTLWSLYPNPVRVWISRNGGLGPDTIYLSGPELFAMYPKCH